MSVPMRLLSPIGDVISDGCKVDLKMVIHKANIQAEDAAKLTRILKAAKEFHDDHPEYNTPRITQVGHSLGGTLAQIQSYRFKQEELPLTPMVQHL